MAEHRSCKADVVGSSPTSGFSSGDGARLGRRLNPSEPRDADTRAYLGRVMIDFTQMKSFCADPLILTEGDGVRVKDTDGRWYFDGLSGTFCMSLGHGNRRVVEAAADQMGRLALAAPTMATSDRSLELAQQLLALLPPQYTHVKWGSGGSEAVEAAIKMARQYHRQAGDPRKYKILSHYRALPRCDRARAGCKWLAHEPQPLRAASGRIHPSAHARPVPAAVRG